MRGRHVQRPATSAIASRMICTTASGAVTIGAAGTLTYTASTSTARNFTLNGGAIQANAGAAVTYTGVVSGGYLEGAGVHVLGAGCSLIVTTTFAGTTIKSNFLCNLGHGDASKVFPRNPRLSFEEACQVK